MFMTLSGFYVSNECFGKHFLHMAALNVKRAIKSYASPFAPWCGVYADIRQISSILRGVDSTHTKLGV